MRYIIVSSLLFLFMMMSFSSPTSVIIKGKVKDNNGKPVTGVLVTEKGTGNYTSTDTNGDFRIAVASEKSQLLFFRKGFVSTVLTVLSTANMAVVLKPGINETTVSAYQEKKKMIAQSESFLASRAPSAIASTNGYYRTPSFHDRAIAAPSAKPYNNYPGKSKMEDWRSNNDYNTEDYDAIVENRFLSASDNALSTFSIDVDAASYSNIRRYLQMGQMPPAGSVRIEEMVNYFRYEYPQPLGEAPFSINTEMSDCPWNTKHQLVLIGLQGKKIATEKLPPSNIVFLIDVSGSMMAENKLPLVQASMKLLVEQLREQDNVSIVVYAGNAGLVLPPTNGSEKMKIRDAIDNLQAGGSTAGGEGIKLAYKTAKRNFITKGNNRVILCTDGDFNVGASSDAELESLIEQERKSGVFLTVLGYGMGNYKDNKMQKLANKGNGNHAYIDGLNEAKKVLVHEFGGTLFTIAKDVKLQVEFNPAKVQAYRLIGYENRLLNKEDFNNDAKDAGELGSGHTVTALYEVIPVGVKNDFAEKVDPLKYQRQNKLEGTSNGHHVEVMTIKFRYKKPDEDISKLIEHAVGSRQSGLANASSNFRFAAAVAEFGMLLRNSEFKQSSSFQHAWQLAKDAVGKDEEGYRSELLQLIKSSQAYVLQQKQDDREDGTTRVINH